LVVIMDSITATTSAPTRDVNPQHLLYSLMVPAVLMPLTGWMFSVSLPIIRDDFGITADVAAWIATAFSLPFLVFLPVYGRISDGLGKRRLLIMGILVFLAGTLIALFSPSMPWLIVGRAVQGFGAASLLPLSLALIAETFPSDRRGKAMGQWSTIGPVTGAFAPILAGFLISKWGWRISFTPAAIFAFVSLTVVYLTIPASNIHDTARPKWFSLDWTGIALLAALLSSMLAYVSSRPITGVPALQDFRLLGLAIVFLVSFIVRERSARSPFIRLGLFKNQSLLFASISAGLRMLTLGGATGFIMPLYLADIKHFTPERSGIFLMILPVAMTTIVRVGGNISDRLGSRSIVMVGFSVVSLVLIGLSRLPAGTPDWVLALLLAAFGLGAGLMLASLHRAALSESHDEELGASSGIYSMIRFLGSAFGAAIGGILLQGYLDDPQIGILPAYQNVFIWFTGFGLLGLLFSARIPKTSAEKPATPPLAD